MDSSAPSFISRITEPDSKARTVCHWPIITYAPSPSGHLFSSRPIIPGNNAIAPTPSTATESARQPSPKNNSPKTSNKITHLVFINQLSDTLIFPSTPVERDQNADAREFKLPTFLTDPAKYGPSEYR
jgi:hypothetical protein